MERTIALFWLLQDTDSRLWPESMDVDATGTVFENWFYVSSGGEIFLIDCYGNKIEKTDFADLEIAAGFSMTLH